MIICRTKSEIRAAAAQWSRAGETVGVVPTMGALHEGHLTLVDVAARECDRVIATVFVNPLQFAPHEDFDAYPRDLESDGALLAGRGCDGLFAPAQSELFAPDFSTNISVGGVGEGHCAVARPHFFDGVATIVAKLLLVVLPDIAVFGEKDFQQLAVIRRMVRDLDLGVDILSAPIVREADGLAMSSRNQYLSAAERAIAPALHSAIKAAADAIAAPGAAWSDIGAIARDEILAAGFSSVDYVNFVRAVDLETIDRAGPSARILAAARLGETRLIDNIAVAPRP